VQLRLGSGSAEREAWIRTAVKIFEEIRELPLKKKPATAELLAWLRALELLWQEQGGGDPQKHKGYPGTTAVLAKNKADLDLMMSKMGKKP
jgi:hypothetical protein